MEKPLFAIIATSVKHSFRWKSFVRGDTAELSRDCKFIDGISARS
jgi:hypothetical protein